MIVKVVVERNSFADVFIEVPDGITMDDIQKSSEIKTIIHEAAIEDVKTNGDSWGFDDDFCSNEILEVDNKKAWMEVLDQYEGRDVLEQMTIEFQKKEEVAYDPRQTLMDFMQFPIGEDTR